MQPLCEQIVKRSLGIFCVLLLAGCAPQPDAIAPAPSAVSQVDQNSPQGVVQDFFEGLVDALRDPDLADSEVRNAHADRIAQLFAPDEQDAMSTAMARSFRTFAESTANLQPDQQITFEINAEYANFQLAGQQQDRALVRVNDATVSVVISTGTAVDFRTDVDLAEIIGRSDGTIPTVRIGRIWYLTQS